MHCLNKTIWKKIIKVKQFLKTSNLFIYNAFNLFTFRMMPGEIEIGKLIFKKITSIRNYSK